MITVGTVEVHVVVIVAIEEIVVQHLCVVLNALRRIDMGQQVGDVLYVAAYRVRVVCSLCCMFHLHLTPLHRQQRNDITIHTLALISEKFMDRLNADLI